MKTIDKEELKKVIAAHEEWVFDEDKGERANLSLYDLRGHSIINKNLSGAILRGASFDGGDLHGTKFHEADMRECSLLSTNIKNCDFAFADLSHSKMSHVEATGASFRDTNMRCVESLFGKYIGAYFEDTDLRHSRFYSCDTSDARFQGADMMCADFRLTNLHVVLEFNDVRINRAWIFNIHQIIGGNCNDCLTLIAPDGDTKRFFFKNKSGFGEEAITTLSHGETKETKIWLLDSFAKLNEMNKNEG